MNELQYQYFSMCLQYKRQDAELNEILVCTFYEALYSHRGLIDPPVLLTLCSAGASKLSKVPKQQKGLDINWNIYNFILHQTVNYCEI